MSRRENEHQISKRPDRGNGHSFMSNALNVVDRHCLVVNADVDEGQRKSLSAAAQATGQLPARGAMTATST